MQNPIQKFIQSSIVFEKPGILSENLRFSIGVAIKIAVPVNWCTAPVSLC